MDSFTLNLLKIFSQRHSLSLVGLAAILNADELSLAEPIQYLREQGYIKIEPNTFAIHGDELTFHTPLVISHPGRIALEQELKSRKRFKYGEIRAWITIAIALSAFIKSFFF